MKTSKLLIGVLIFGVALALWFGGVYNSLISSNTEVDRSWAQVEAQYQRRFDLIPNLVESTKGVLTQEQEVFTAIANARQGYAGAKTVDEKAAAAGQLESSLSRLLVITENYPTLQSNKTVQDLMTELAGTENRISVERNRYNDAVGKYNIAIKKIPTVFVARMFGFSERKYFESVPAAQTAPKVDLNINK